MPSLALATYDALPNSGGSATANYLLNGAGTLTGSLAANSLKIANSDVNQTFDLGSNTLTVTTTSATALGGVLYAGGGNNTYTINGTGGLLASSTTGELVIHTHVGTLTVNAPVVTSGATAGQLTKSGNGSLVLGGTNVYTGATRVASGKLFFNGSLSNQNATLTVNPGATLGGSGTVGRNVTIANGGKLEFNLGTAAASHLPLTRSSSRTMVFSGSSVLTITAGADAASGLYTLITGGNNITGSAPATVILPPGWTADAPVISGNQLRINITNVVAPPANAAPAWTDNPVNEVNATEDAVYSSTLANDATDSNNDVLTFLKVSGPSWLDIATNGTLSGTPTNSDVGANTFTVSVADGIAPAVEATLNITVTNTNDAPVWNSDPLIGPDATEDATIQPEPCNGSIGWGRWLHSNFLESQRTLLVECRHQWHHLRHACQCRCRPERIHRQRDRRLDSTGRDHAPNYGFEYQRSPILDEQPDHRRHHRQGSSLQRQPRGQRGGCGSGCLAHLFQAEWPGMADRGSGRRALRNAGH